MTVTRTWTELKAEYLLVPPNSTRDRKYRVYRKADLVLVGASASLPKLNAIANADADYVASIKNAEG